MIDFENLLKKTRIYEALKSDAKEGALSHCIMIISEDEIACRNLCKILARMLICEHDDCGICKDCKQVENGLHPNLIVPENITVDGIREFIPKCYTVTDGKLKVALISNFDEITLREQNRLLKLIEEPAKDTIFIMGVTKPANVLETIKSRSTKYYIESFNKEELEEALIAYADPYNAKKAMMFADGSITKAKNILSNASFIDCYNTMLNIFAYMEKSSGLLELVSQVPLKQKKQAKDRCELLRKYLDAFEIIVKQVVEYKTHLNEDVDDIIKDISGKYNMATLVNVEDLIIQAKQKNELYCDAEGVFYQLLMDILEVRFKCQL